MKLLLEWSSHLQELVRNVHNDRVLERLQDPMVQYDQSTVSRKKIWDVRCSADMNFVLRKAHIA